MRIALLIFTWLLSLSCLLGQIDIHPFPANEGLSDGRISVVVPRSEDYAGPFTIRLSSSCEASGHLEQFTFETRANFPDLAPGNYAITIIDKEECKTCYDIEVTETPHICQLDASVKEIINVSVCDYCAEPYSSQEACNNDGSITIDVLGEPIYNLSWHYPDGTMVKGSNDGGSETISELPLGTYRVKISTPFEGCDRELRIQIKACEELFIDDDRYGNITCVEEYLVDPNFPLRGFINADFNNNCSGSIYNYSLNDRNIGLYSSGGNNLQFHWEDDLGNNLGSNYFIEDLCGNMTYHLKMSDGCNERIYSYFVESCRNNENITYEVIESESCAPSSHRIIVRRDMYNSDGHAGYAFLTRGSERYSYGQLKDSAIFNVMPGIYDIHVGTTCDSFIFKDIEVETQCEKPVYRNSSWIFPGFRIRKDDPCDDGFFDSHDIKVEEYRACAGCEPPVTCGYKLKWPDGRSTEVEYFWKDEGTGRSWDSRITGVTDYNINFGDESSRITIEVRVTSNNGCGYEIPVTFWKEHTWTNWYSGYPGPDNAVMGYFQCESCDREGRSCDSSPGEYCDETAKVMELAYEPFDLANPCAGGLLYYETGSGQLGDEFRRAAYPIYSEGVELGLSTPGGAGLGKIDFFFDERGCGQWASCLFSRDDIQLIQPLSPNYPECDLPYDKDIILFTCIQRETPQIVRIDTSGLVVDSSLVDDDCGDIELVHLGDCIVELTCTDSDDIEFSGNLITCQVVRSDGTCDLVYVCEYDCTEIEIISTNVSCDPTLKCSVYFPTVCN